MKQVILSTLFFSFVCTLAAQPVINSFSPLKGAVGTLVTINGAGFGSTPVDNIVYFGSVRGTVLTASSTELTLLAPAGTSYKPITVTTGHLTAYSKQPFVVTFPGGGSPFSAANFPVRDDYPSGTGSQKIIAADYDVDGKPDVATCHAPFNNEPAILTYSNVSTLGNPLLGSGIVHSVFAGAQSLANADFDGDGLLDIIVAVNYNGYVSVLQNTSTAGAMSFNNRIDVAVPGSLNSTYEVAMADFDADGKPDFAISFPGQSYTSVFRNTSSGGIISFSYVSDFATAGGSENMATADIDGDGKTDLLVSVFIGGEVSVLRNTSITGAISFAPKVDFFSGANGNGIETGDLDEDGKPDMVVSEYVFGFNGPQGNDRVNVFRNTSTPGNISFAPKVAYPVGLNPFKPAIGDIDGDGKIDMAVNAAGSGVNLYNALTLYRNTSTPGNISFDAGYEYTTLNTPWSCEIGDLDLDGKPEIMVTNWNSPFISVFRNNIGSTVPLQLINFDARKNGFTNQLNWATANELNTMDFIIEYSFDGRVFTPGGTVAASGTSREHTYSFTHAIQHTGKIYYRLKMVDRNGSYTYSPVKVITMVGTAVSVWPNPASKLLNIQGDGLQQVTIIDNLGRVLFDKKLVNAGNAQLDISTLPKGYCWVKISGRLQTTTEKLLIE